MTKVIKSATSDARYFLTIDNATGHSTDCTCKDHQFRPGRSGGCKHMSGYNTCFEQAVTFAELRRRYDVRGECAQAARREAYCVEFAIYN